MSSQKSVEVHFGSSAHPSGGLRFGAQPHEHVGEQHQSEAAEGDDETEATPAAG
jgi:hypothetical protein